MIEALTPKFDTVMIIDDNVIDLYIASRMITQNNFGKKVLLYSEAEEAMKYLQDNQDNISELPQVLFVDIYMPLMSGFEFLEAYEKLSAAVKKHCKAYIISSTIDNEDIARSNSNKNVISFHVKPITKEFLDRIV
ncbi:MAG: response regulator [Flavobacterium circumlabens]|uniref:Response regulator n=1 Tax=Flavobacterium circumlabens TaxID=2133765 RepID=A0A4Y7U7C2_9FLAO|nr:MULTISPECIES: response regulator [Flavobacterium]QSB29115.1 response regulator [Flavobacterium sp. CLA17]TCN53103.1 response regulator receiver domain-containing protein [Flavobacterium circumlabens]TEB42346.1 response regulator [Flavobacterium circumlabens]